MIYLESVKMDLDFKEQKIIEMLLEEKEEKELLGKIKSGKLIIYKEYRYG